MVGRLRVSIIAILGMCASTLAEGLVKCAIIPGKDLTPEVPALVSLLEAELSQDGRIQLLERSELDRVLREQRLTAAGLAERENIMKAGRLLRADAFIFITPEEATPRDSAGTGERGPVDRSLPEQPAPRIGPPAPARGDVQSPAGQLIRIRVVETAHGLRLWEGYERLIQGDAEAVSTRIAGTLLDVLQKIAVPSGEVVPIGIVDIHRVQLPEKYEPLARVLPGLLSTRLGKEARIIMLERESLGTLLREKQLTEGNESAFWNSAVLIDGYIQPREKDIIQINLRLRKGSGEVLAVVGTVMDSNAVSVAVDRAAMEISKAVLRASSIAAWDSAKEAAEFHRQGQLLAAHHRHKAANTMFEEAHALLPQNVHYTGALFKNEWGSPSHARQIDMNLTEDFSYSPAELAELASVLVRQIRDAYNNGQLQPRELRSEYIWTLGPEYTDTYFASSAAVATEQVRLMNRVNRRIWVETLDKALTAEGRQNGDPDAFAHIQGYLGWIWSDQAQERMSYLKKTINGMIMPPELGGKFKSADRRLILCGQVLFGPGSEVVSGHTTGDLFKDMGDGFPALWNDYLSELVNVNDPLVNLWALMTQVNRAALSQDTASAYNFSCRTVTVLQEMLQRYGETISDPVKRRLYWDVGCCLKDVSRADPNGAMDLWEKVLIPFIKAGDVRSLALWFPYRSPVLPTPGSEAGKRHFRMLQKAANVLRNSDNDPDASAAVAFLDGHLKQLEPRVNWQPLSPTAAESFAPAQGKDPPYMCFTVAQDLLVIAYFRDESYLDLGCTINVAAVDLKDFRLLSRRTIHLHSSGKGALASILSIAVTGDTAFMGLSPRGIVRVREIATGESERDEEGEMLAEKDGLPSLRITGLTQDGTRLWVAYGGEEQESGLGSYDPTTGQWETRFCSTVRGDTSLSAGMPYVIRHLTIFAPDRLFFDVDQEFTIEQMGQVEYFSGLWSINTTTGELTYHQLDAAHGIIPEGQKLLLTGRECMAEFDPSSKRADMLLGRVTWARHLPGGEITAVELREAPFAPASTLQKVAGPPRSFTPLRMTHGIIHEDTLWVFSAADRLATIPRAAKEDQIATFGNDLLGGKPATGLWSTPYGLLAFGGNNVGLVDTGSHRAVKMLTTFERSAPGRR
jgi:hypothetical protein